jgi:lysophospholipase L1-like esterase
MRGAVAYGDCNTEGLKGVRLKLWPEIVCDALSLELKNCGHTMSTTRELLFYNRDFPASSYSLAFIQYGLVDSWLTFRGAPYVLYYPDNPRRKVARKIVKKLKKWARAWHLQDRIGAVEQVPLPEYISNIQHVVDSAPGTVFVLVATAPNLDEPRNPRIKQYNEALREIAQSRENVVYAETFKDLWSSRKEALMDDGTHLTGLGHELVAARVIGALNSLPFTPGKLRE